MQDYQLLNSMIDVPTILPQSSLQLLIGFPWLVPNINIYSPPQKKQDSLKKMARDFVSSLHFVREGIQAS